MMSRDTKTPHTRFELCQKSVLQILQNQVRDTDLVGVVCFGPNVTSVANPLQKTRGGQVLRNKIAGLRPQTAGGTCFYDSILHCLQTLDRHKESGAARWLICLTDGDDLGSRRENMSGQLVTQMLQTSMPASLNMVLITVGALHAKNLRIMNQWVDLVKAGGGHGQLVENRDAGAITMAFQVVAECLAAEVGGATEC